MLRYFYSTVLFLISLTGFSQPSYRVFDFIDPTLKSINVGLNLGGSSYYGDLSKTSESYKRLGSSFGVYTKYKFNDYFHTSLDLNYYRISSNDFTPKRNLSFRSDNFELIGLGYFEFLNYNTFRRLKRSEFPLSLHIVTGLGITSNNPKTFYNGQWVDLRPLRTENVDYSPVALVIPVGFGLSIKLDKFVFVLNSVYRFSTTDYLDDVSNVYADPTSFNNDLSRQLNHRGSVWYGPNSKRGNPLSKDGYLINTIGIEYKISNKRITKVLFNR